MRYEVKVVCSDGDIYGMYPCADNPDAALFDILDAERNRSEKPETTILWVMSVKERRE